MMQVAFEVEKATKEHHTMAISHRVAMNIVEKLGGNNIVDANSFVIAKKPYWYTFYELKLVKIANQYFVKCDDLQKTEWFKAFGFNVHKFR